MTLPTAWPAVIETTPERPRPLAIKPLTQVSETHSLLTALESPIRVRADVPVAPSAEPRRVTLDDPVEPAFAGRTWEMATDANEAASVHVATWADAVTRSVVLRPPPLAALHCTLLSEDHRVPSCAVPVWTLVEWNVAPNPDPTKVTLVEPVVGTFPLLLPLIIATP